MSADDWHFDNDGNIVAVTRAGDDPGEKPSKVWGGGKLTEEQVDDFAKFLGL